MAAESTVELSREECLEYVRGNLFVENAQEKLNSDRLQLLNEILCSFQQRLPIQSITIHLQPFTQRRRPCWARVKETVMQGLGGLCYELNIFMFALLQGLGYDVFLVKSSVRLPDNHVVTIARNVARRGDLFLVDAGCGFPTFQAVDLNFHKESPEYYQSFLRYKFVKEDGKILRMHRSRELTSKESQHDCDEGFIWKRNYDFELCPVTVEDINKCFDYVFETSSSTSSHRVLRCTLFPGQKACALRNDTILIENQDRELEEHKYEKDDELVAAICNNFPVFQPNRPLVKDAVTCWRKLQNGI